MLDASYIGDELIGTGLALAGVRVHPAPGSTEALWELVVAERTRRQLVMIAADSAHAIRERLSLLLETEPMPPVVILPDAGMGGGPADVIDEAMKVLGLEALPE